MSDPHTYPTYIFTNNLSISHILISHESSQVTVLGCYNDLVEDGMPTICFETDFASLNDLLAELGDEAESAINQISKCLLNPSNHISTIDLCDEGGINFSNHLFSFLLIDEQEGKMIQEEKWTYRLIGCIVRDEILSDFIDCAIPVSVSERLTYFNAVLAMQYQFYLAYSQKMENNAAIIYANLSDPLIFNLAKTMYELQITGQTK